MTEKGRRFKELLGQPATAFEKVSVGTFQNASTGEWFVHVFFDGEDHGFQMREETARVLAHALDEALLGVEKLRAGG
jgi:hypothetical protein